MVNRWGGDAEADATTAERLYDFARIVANHDEAACRSVLFHGAT